MPESRVVCSLCLCVVEWKDKDYFAVNGHDDGYWRSHENGIYCPARLSYAGAPLDAQAPGPRADQQHIPGNLPDLADIPAIEEWLNA